MSNQSIRFYGASEVLEGDELVRMKHWLNIIAGNAEYFAICKYEDGLENNDPIILELRAIEQSAMVVYSFLEGEDG